MQLYSGSYDPTHSSFVAITTGLNTTEADSAVDSTLRVLIMLKIFDEIVHQAFKFYLQLILVLPVKLTQ